MFLIEALRYDVPAFHEDRLTQIVAATFNESKAFQSLFLRFLGVPHRNGLQAKTQVSNEEAPSRPDLILFHGEFAYVIVESKVDAKSNRDQQIRHGRIKASHYFLIVRDPVDHSRIGAKLKKVTWFDFFSFLQNAKSRTRDSIDGFLINKMISFGKECEMLLPDRITKADFDSAREFLTQTRLRGCPFHSFEKRNPFQSLDSMSQFLERALIRLKDEPVVGNKLKPFVRRLGLSYLCYGQIDSSVRKNRSTAERRDLRLKSDTISLAKEIKLKKPTKGFHSLYVRISFVPFLRRKDLSEMTFSKIAKADLEKVAYRCEVSAGFVDGNRLNHDLFYYDDSDDLSFSVFYREAVKAWKRNLLK